MPVSGQWRPKNGISFKGINSNESLKSNILYKAAFVKGNYVVLNNSFLNYVKFMCNIIVSKSKTLIMWYTFNV